jgi:hypothetical protein
MDQQCDDEQHRQGEKEARCAMTDIDLHAHIQIFHGEEQATARVPLAGQVTPELARTKNLPVQIEELPGRAWIRVQVPARGDRDDGLAMLDAARTFLAEAEAAAGQPSATSHAEAIVREW